jgi:hypothetical protein
MARWRTKSWADMPALRRDPNRPENVLEVDADEDGVGGDAVEAGGGGHGINATVEFI